MSRSRVSGSGRATGRVCPTRCMSGGLCHSEWLPASTGSRLSSTEEVPVSCDSTQPQPSTIERPSRSDRLPPCSTPVAIAGY